MITIYEPTATDFTHNGIAVLTPESCTVHERAGGTYELSLTHPITEDGRWRTIVAGAVVKAPVPNMRVPAFELMAAETVLPTLATEEWEVSVPSGKPLMMRSRPTLDDDPKVRNLASYKNGTRVTVLSSMGAWKKCTINGYTGWMYAQFLRKIGDVNTPIDPNNPGAATPKTWDARLIGAQLFRLDSVTVDSENGVVEAQGSHVFYDMIHNITRYKTPEGTYDTPETAIQGMMANLVNDEAFTGYSNLTTTFDKYDMDLKNPVNVLLDPDEGIVPKNHARIIRDNYDFYVTGDVETDRGKVIRDGKDLIGVQITTDLSGVITRILPYGETKDGETLLPDSVYLDSAHIADYATIHAQAVKYSVKEGEDGLTLAQAKQKLLDLAQADFDAGCDLPKVTMTVNFQALGDTREYDQYRGLEHVELYDTVRIVDSVTGTDVKTRVNEYTYDCLSGGYIEIVCGDLQEALSTIAGAQLPTGGVSGTKLVPQSVSGLQLTDGAVTSLKIGTAAIETANIADAAITTAKISAATISELKVEDWISATKGFFERIIVKAENGYYYELSCSWNGEVTATPYTPTPAEIAAGITDDERAIVDTDIAAGDLEPVDIADTNALYNALLACNTDVETLFARSAVIQQLAVATVGSLLNGSVLEMNENRVRIGTPEFLVDITNAGEQMLQIDADGVYAKRYLGDDIEGLAAARRLLAGPEVTVSTVAEIGDLLTNRQIDHDVTVLLDEDATADLDDGLTLFGISGSGQLTISTTGYQSDATVRVRLLGGVNVRDCDARIEFVGIPSAYDLTRSPRITFSDCDGAGGATTVTATVTLKATTTADYKTVRGTWAMGRQSFAAGVDWEGYTHYAGIWWDLSAIPQGATISNVMIRLRRTDSAEMGGTRHVHGYTSGYTAPAGGFSVSNCTSTGVDDTTGSAGAWYEMSESAATVEALRTGCYVLIGTNAANNYNILYGSESADPPELILTYSYTSAPSAFSEAWSDQLLERYLGKLGLVRHGTLTNCEYVVVAGIAIAWGTATAYSSTTTLSNVYSGLFASGSTPNVTASWCTTATMPSGDWGVLKVAAVTENGFAVQAGGSSPSSAQGISWRAIGPAA